MSDGRKEYEAMMAAINVVVDGCILSRGHFVEDCVVKMCEWRNTSKWTPTEQHETVTAMLVESSNNFDDNELAPSALFNAWRAAGKPGLPKPPPEIWGPELVSVAGRMPVVRREDINHFHSEAEDWLECTADSINWTKPQVFRRKLADHPGDAYTLGAVETVPDDGVPVGLLVSEWVAIQGARVRAFVVDWPAYVGHKFQRVLDLAK